jgi:hypothetical protein
MMVELLVAGSVVVFVALLAWVGWVRRGREPRASVSEAQARENAAPLTAAILARARVSAAVAGEATVERVISRSRAVGAPPGEQPERGVA